MTLPQAADGSPSAPRAVVGHIFIYPGDNSGFVGEPLTLQRWLRILGADFKLLSSLRHDHTTPWGSLQRFHFGFWKLLLGRLALTATR